MTRRNNSVADHMTGLHAPPEDEARKIIDAKLTRAGWRVQTRDALDLFAGPEAAQEIVR